MLGREFKGVTERAGITATAVSAPWFRIMSNVLWLAPPTPPRDAPKARGRMPAQQMSITPDFEMNIYDLFL
jgi:hypothetical protein